MESPRILVTGFPEDTTKTQLFIYFQSERDSGGGDVESIEIDRGRAVISFEDAKAAVRVFNRTNHLFRDCQLQVALLSKQACSNQKKPSTFKEVESPGGRTTCTSEWKKRSEEPTSVLDGQQTVPNKGRRELLEPSQSFSNGSAAHHSQCTIVVTGIPHDATEDLVVNYFENTKRSKGGPVSDVSINPELKMCKVTFECPDDAMRTVEHSPHNMSGACLQVSLFDEFEDESLDDSEENVGDLEEGITIIVSGISTSTTEDAVCNYFENSRRSGGGEVSKIDYNDDEETVITFLEVKDLQRLLEGKHSIKGKPITVRRQRPKTQSLNSSVTHRSHCTIEVTGLPQDATEDLVVNYFENTKRSKGGPVYDVSINPELQTCKVTFESPDAARRTVEHSPHNLSGACLQVSLFDEFEDESLDDSEENVGDLEEGITIIVSGISTSTTEDAVCNYFENSRRSGGGEVSKIDYNDDEETVITFLEVKDLKRLLEGKHSIDGKPITVTRQRPLKRLPPDPVRIHIQGLSEKTTKDCLSFYLEKFSGNALVTKVFFGAKNNALVVFDTPPDFQLLFDKVHKDTKGLDKSKPRLECVPICSSILVTGLKDETSDDTIGLYFENEKRSGGKDVSQVERKGKDEALVSFQDHASVEKVIQKSHTLEGKQLKVTPHYPFLQDATTRKTEIPFDPDVFHYIQMTQEPELQMVLEECKVQVEFSNNLQAKSIVVCPTDNKKNNVQAWRDKVGRLESFLQSFKKSQLEIASEIFDEIVQRWEKQSSIQGPCNFLVSFDDHRRLAQIIGKVAYVDKEEQKLQELIREVTEDTELMKSVVKVVEDNIPKSKLTLLEMSGICERLRNEHRHLSIAIDSNGQKLCLQGPRSDLQEVRIEVFAFISRIVEQTTELPAKVINVLKRPQVSRFIQDVLKQNSIQAVLFYDQRQSSNEVQVVGVDSRNALDAENVLQATIKEQSHHLSDENARVLEGRHWKDFQSSIASQFKVGITVDNHASTIWVSGISEDVEKCFKEVKTFLEMNTILRTTIPIEHGTTRFLTEVWKEKLEGIKTDLANCSIDMRVTANTEGIEISGTADGLKKCLPQLQALIHAVQMCSVPIDKPGMKKFFAEEKGQHLLKATGEKHRCIILRGERKKGDALEGDTVAGEKEVGSASEHICSYLTKEEKRISVLKGDITKDRVDAIVNAANGDLNHIGGLAAAIVRAGGNEIQQQCTAFVRENGPLLEGQAMISTAGRLPCNQVIHAVGPKWDHIADQQHKEGQTTKQERYLKFAITNSLNKATKLRSIAIPAVSSGVFGVPRDICAKVIVDAILDFCEENPLCNLSDIHLINIDDPTVSAFAKEMKKRFAEDRNFKEQSNYRRPVAAYGFTRDSNASAEKSFTTQGICITVKAGDLAKEQADILVGTAASNLNLSQNPCAKALSQAAGPSLQQECTNIGRVAVGDIAVNNQPGNLNCKAVIFAICSEWDSGKGKKVLKRLLTKCLQTASTQGMTSIAFPAIGTGTLQFPRAEVAEIYFDEVISFKQRSPTTSLKEVRFVLYAPDQPTVQAFEAELKKRMANNAPLSVGKRPRDFQASSSQTTAFSPVRERDQDHLETTVGTLCFKVQSGDITKETTDAIVIISNKELDIKRGGGAGAAILKSGGYSIQQECSQKGPQHPGSVVVTKAGNLNTRFILHIVPSKHQSVKASVLKCLQEAENKGLSSITFPAIGTGNLGMSAIDCARTMLTAIREFNDQQPTSMQLIKMVIFQKEMMKDVRSAIEEASGETPSEKPGIIRRVVSRVGDFLGFGDSDKTASSRAASLDAYDRSFNLAIFAGLKEDLEAAVTEIKEVMKEKSTKQVIENGAITALTEKHRQKIHTLELRYDVEATVEKEVGRVVVRGQTDDILNVVGEIYKILDQVKEDEHERKRAEVLSKDIQWRYKDADKFVDYDSHTNAKIETAHHENKPDVSIMGGSYKIVFSSMTCEDRFGSTVADVERVDRRALPVPKHWNPQPKDQDGFEKAVHLYELDPAVDVQEYQSVQNQFQQTCGNGIIKIERIQNPALYVTYAIRKKTMDEAKGSNERMLFHGTPGDNCQLINKTGFNRSFHGKNATMYGNGVYFASNASYSARSTYSPTDMNGYRYMYLTRVLVGDYTVGRQGLLTPPPKNVDPTDTYDSVVDQIPNPTIFVVFYDWQCYPEYLITFQ